MGGRRLFFSLSGFLITSNLLAARDKPHYFHNFHARRALRIWPVYVLVLAVVYLNAPWFIGPSVLGCGQDRALAGLHLFRAESLSPDAAAGARAHLGAGYRGAVLLSLGAAGALPAPALDAGGCSGGGAGLPRRCCATTHSPGSRPPTR